MGSGEIIHCIGDSHASFFSGYDKIQNEYPQKSLNKYPQLKSYRLGAVLAYSLTKNGTKEKGREKLFELIKELEPGSKILLCFGEIDNRCHLVKQASLQKKTLKEIAVLCVRNYFQVIDELTAMGFNCFVFGAVASCNAVNIEYPTYGTMTERNNSTKYFNEALKYECQKRDLTFISLFEYLVNKNNETKVNYFFDGVHLGQIAFPFFLKETAVLKSMNKIFKKGQLEISGYILLSKFLYFKKTFAIKLKRGLRVEWCKTFIKKKLNFFSGLYSHT